MEQLTSFVSSRGILKSCEMHNQSPESSAERIDQDLVVSATPGAAIYVCTHALRKFAIEFLPGMRSPFVLVSGDSDLPVDEELLADPDVARLLSSPLLIRWLAQNLAARRPKLQWLPIGLDYHTMWNNPCYWGIEAVSPIAQEHQLLDTLASSPVHAQRQTMAYCNWHLAAHAMNSPDRRDCLENIDKSICFFEPNHVPRASTWSRQVEFRFVVSPEGMGLDCHRTWEALFLGCIPVVKRNALAAHQEDLPILLVDRWRDLSPRKLSRFSETLESRKFDFSRLFREYWVRRIRGMDAPLLAPMTLAEFRTLLTRRTA